IRFMWGELKLLVDSHLLREKFEEETNLMNQVLSNIASIKTIITKETTPAHKYLANSLDNINVWTLTNNDLIINNVVDLGALNIPGEFCDILVGERGGIRELRWGEFLDKLADEF
ncbi:2768_t:CDS:2, partial [Paraglomus occultum]